jgi:hypothetical protein
MYAEYMGLKSICTVGFAHPPAAPSLETVAVVPESSGPVAVAPLVAAEVPASEPVLPDVVPELAPFDDEPPHAARHEETASVAARAAKARCCFWKPNFIFESPGRGLLP